MNIVVFWIVLDKSEQSLEYNWMPEISTTRAVAVDTSSPLHITALGSVLHIAHIKHTEGTFLDELQQEKMNRVSFIVQNHAYPREVELDEAEVDPVDIAPLVSGDAPIITAPASG